MTQDRQDKKRKETWQDWVPDAPKLDSSGLLSQDDVLAWLNVWGHPVEPRTFKDWREKGLLPSPTQGGKGKTRVTWYAWWVADLARDLAELRDREKVQGRKTPITAHIQRLRIMASQLAQHPPPREKSPPMVSGLGKHLLKSPYERAMYVYHHPEIIPPLFVFDPTAQPQPLHDLPGAPVTMLANVLAKMQRDHYGITIEGAQLRLLGAHGEQIVFTIPLEETSAPPMHPPTP